MPEEKKDNKIEHVEGGKTINQLIDDINRLEALFNKDFKGPLGKQKAASLKQCGLEKVAGADVKVAYLGSVLAMVSAAGLTQKDLINNFKFKQEAPFVEVKVIDEWKATFESLEEWIKLYVEKV